MTKELAKIVVMTNLQVKNIPDTLHQKLCERASDRNQTINDLILDAIEREVARQEWLERLTQRSQTNLGTSAAALLEEERSQHEGFSEP